MPLPRSVSQNSHSGLAWLIFVGKKRPALQRRNFQHIKEAGRNKKRTQAGWGFLAGQDHAAVLIGGHLLKSLALAAPVQKVIG